MLSDREDSAAKRFGSLWLLMAFGLALLGLQKFKILPESLERSLYDHAYAPLRHGLYLPLQAWKNWRSKRQSEQELSQELAELRQHNRELQAQLHLLSHYRAENHRLRRLMESVPTVTEALLIAELRDTALDGYSEQVTINKGEQHGVFINQAVIDPYGLVGQVTDIYGREAKIMLISDARSRVPVYVERTHQRAIVAGGGGYGSLLLSDLRLDSDIREGDRLISSGLGGVFPRGYPVAQVVAVQRDQRASFLEVKLQPLAHLNSMLEVLLLAPADNRESIEVGPHEGR